MLTPIHPKPREALREAIRSVHQMAGISLPGNDETTRPLAIGVTSPQASEGKTTVALALASSLAEDLEAEESRMVRGIVDLDETVVRELMTPRTEMVALDVKTSVGAARTLFLDAGHVVITTSNAFNQDQDSDIRLLAEPHPVIDIAITDEPKTSGAIDVTLSLQEAKNKGEAANKIYHYMKDHKILTGHNYSI